MQLTNVAADTREMTRDEWLEARRKGIGGSDASTILGLNPYSTPLRLYLEKIGKAGEKETNEAMRQGTDLEAYVAERFTEETGLKVKRVNKILRHPDYPWMQANIDRAVVGKDAGLECKTTSPYSKFKFDDGEINPHYYWQSMHYMAVTGAKMWYVAILVLGKAFHVFSIPRDEGAIEYLIAAEKEFWEGHVVPQVPPLPTGNEADDEAVQTIYPMGDDGDEIMALDGMDDLLNLRALKVQEKDELENKIREIDQQVKLALGSTQKGVSAGWRVNWTNTTTARIDAKKLREMYPDIAEEVTKTTAGRRFSITKIKEDN